MRCSSLVLWCLCGGVSDGWPWYHGQIPTRTRTPSPVWVPVLNPHKPILQGWLNPDVTAQSKDQAHYQGSCNPPPLLLWRNTSKMRTERSRRSC